MCRHHKQVKEITEMRSILQANSGEIRTLDFETLSANPTIL